MSGAKVGCWIVTEGEYSDYHIVDVFATRALAVEYVGLFGGEVEEWTIEEEMPPYVESLHLQTDLHVRGEVTGEEEVRSNHLLNQLGSMASIQGTECRHYRFARRWGNELVLCVQVWGSDHERVKKVYSEQVAQAKAQWLEIMVKEVNEKPWLMQGFALPGVTAMTNSGPAEWTWKIYTGQHDIETDEK